MRIVSVLLAVMVVYTGVASDRIPVRTILLHFVPTEMAFQPDGRHLVLMRNQFLAVYDMLQRKVVRTLIPENFNASSFVATNGSVVVVQGGGGYAVYEIDTSRLIYQIQSALRFIAFSPSGNWLVLGGGSQTSRYANFINLFDGRSYTYLYENVYVNYNSILIYPKVCFTPDEQRAVVIVAPQDFGLPQAFVIRLADGIVENQFAFGDSDTLPIDLSTSPSGRYMAIYAWDRRAVNAGRVLMLDLQSGATQLLQGGGAAYSIALAWLSDQTLLASAGYGIGVFTDGILERSIATGFFARRIVIQPGTQRLVATHQYGVHMVDIEGLSATTYPDIISQERRFFGDALLSPNREWMIVPKYHSSLRWMLSLYRLSDFVEVRQLPVSTPMIPIGISDDAQRALTLSSNGRFHFIDLNTGQELWTRTYSTSSSHPTALFLPDGSGLILNIGTRLYRIHSDGTEAWQHQVVAFGLKLVCITPDNKILALRTIFNGAELISIDIESLETHLLYRSGGQFTNAAVTPDNNYIAVNRVDSSNWCTLLVFRYPTMEQLNALLIENYYQYDPVAGTQRIPTVLDSYAANNEFHVLSLGTVFIIDAETARVVRRVPLQNPYNSAFWRIPNGWITLFANLLGRSELVYHPASAPSQGISAISVPAYAALFADADQVIFTRDIGGVLWHANSESWDYQRIAIFVHEFGSGPGAGNGVVGGGYLLTLGHYSNQPYWYAYEWPTLRFVAGEYAPNTSLIENRFDLLVRNRQLYNWITGETLWSASDTGLSDIRGVLFSPDGNYALIELASGVCWMYDTRTNQPLWSRTLYLPSARYSRDSRYLLSGYQVYDVQTGNLVSSFPRQYTVDYFDGRFAVVAQSDSIGYQYHLIAFPSMRTIASFDTSQSPVPPWSNRKVYASGDDRWILFNTYERSVLYPNPYGRTDGDVNLDGCVNDADLLSVLFNFGRSDGLADLNNDGIVDDNDLLIVLYNFGNGC